MTTQLLLIITNLCITSFGFIICIVAATSFISPFPQQSPNAILAQVDEILLNQQTVSQFWRQNLREEIRGDHATDIHKYSWLDAGYEPGKTISLPIEWVHTSSTSCLALKTQKPILDEATVSLLREVASEWWSNESNDKSSFTYQRKGNLEAHLGDLCRKNEKLLVAMRRALLETIYPVVEEHFLQDGMKPHIYDSLIIRYNSTAAENVETGAGQPLHRDLGLVSVNIMLNDDFEGGGTLFEAQLQDEHPTTIQPLKPIGSRHALMHHSCHRHAGAGTFSGTRDILVLFLTATMKKNGSMDPLEQSARIKGRAMTSSKDFTERANLHREAIKFVPDDGEAWHYLGMCLQEISVPEDDEGKRAKILQLSTRALMHASHLIPSDAKLWSNMGITLSKQSHYDREIVEKCYKESLRLHHKCLEVGCDVVSDLETAAFNYGLYLSNLDEWKDAVNILNLIDCTDKLTKPRNEHAEKLRLFCASQLKKESQLNEIHV